MLTDRRTLLQAAAALPLAAAGSRAAFAEGVSSAPAASAPTKGVTHALAHYVVTASYDDLPANVRKEGVRTLLNWVGVAIGGSRHQAVESAVAALAPFSGPQQASLFGRRERFDIMNAAFINGVSSHIFDYDDTHLKSAIHPAGPVASSILALSEMQPVSGKDFLNALVLGVDPNTLVESILSDQAIKQTPTSRARRRAGHRLGTSLLAASVRWAIEVSRLPNLFHVQQHCGVMVASKLVI
jgi:hypothetical protein